MKVHSPDEVCIGEVCIICREQATHHCRETLFDTDYAKDIFETPLVFALGSYLCCEHYWLVFGITAKDRCYTYQIQKDEGR